MVRDPFDRWLTGSAAVLAMLGVGCALVAAFTTVWFNRVVVSFEHKPLYRSRSFTLSQLADGAHNPGRFGDAETLLLIGSIILTGAAVTALIARSHMRARAVASAAMVIGFLLIGWGLKLGKSPLPSPGGFPIAILWEGGEPGVAACEGLAACEAAAVLGLLGALFAALAWGRARWFHQRWKVLEPKSEDGLIP